MPILRRRFRKLIRESTQTDLSKHCQVVVLAGGKSTRLLPLSIDTPKTLIPVCNQPVLGRLLKLIASAGFQSATLSVPLSDVSRRAEIEALTPEPLKLEIKPPNEQFSGTVQDVMPLLKRKFRDVIVIYGDSLIKSDLAALYREHCEFSKMGGKATILYHCPRNGYPPEHDNRTSHGVMSVDDTTGRVTRFVEKPLVDSIIDGFDKANAAVFVCNMRWLRKHWTRARDFSFDVFEPATRSNTGSIFGSSIGAGGYRIDIGTIKGYFDASMDILRGRIPEKLPGRPVFRGCQVAASTNINGVNLVPPVLVGENVNFGAQVRIGPNAIVGNSCQFACGAHVEDSILLDSCTIGHNAIIEKSILGSSCRVGDSQILRPYTVLGSHSQSVGNDWPYPS